MNAREAALTVLNKIDNESAYINAVISEVFRKAGFSAQDRRFVHELVFGCVKNRDLLDHYISMFSKIKIKKMSVSVRNILELGVYQIVFTDRVPVSAACNESAKLAKRYAHRSVGFVNGVLRNLARNRNNLSLPDKENMTEYLSVRYSCPVWLVQKLCGEYDVDFAEKILEAANAAYPPDIRRNRLCAPSDVTEFLEILNNDGIVAEPTELPDCFCVRGALDISASGAYNRGLFTIQSRSSQRAVRALDPQPGETVIDMCAAPGGKTTYIAELMNNRGLVIAFDIHRHKIKLINSAAARLGIDIIRPELRDSTKFCPELAESADRVLADVPCSGLGVMHSKPDIKRYRRQEDIPELCRIQAAVLDAASRYVKPGGVLVYSTCTILKEENESQIKAFLGRNSDYILESEERLFTHIDGGSGFYIARLHKKL